jgi:type IV secretory pathway VirB6-like protein
MLKYLIAVILIGHGFIVSAQSGSNFGSGNSQIANPSWLSWFPMTLGRSWFLTNFKLEGTFVDKVFGLIWLASGLCIVAAALGILGFIVPRELWRTLALYGASGSLIMLLLYLHPFFIIGILLDVAILVALLWAKWPPEILIGA